VDRFNNQHRVKGGGLSSRGMGGSVGWVSGMNGLSGVQKLITSLGRFDTHKGAYS
jgi:hypothetical protein